MNEFNSRISAQRQVLREVNKHVLIEEPLMSLSKQAIERWHVTNNIDKGDPLVHCLFEISKKLFFLANKSQEQITEDYRLLQKGVLELTQNMKQELLNKINR